MTDVVLGTELELVIARYGLGPMGPTLIPAERVILEDLLALAADLYGARATSLGRLQLMDGGVLYIDGHSLEYATPPCYGWADVALHERDLEYLMNLVVSAYKQEGGGELVVNLPGSGPGGETCGYHENYGLRHEDYFKLFSRANFRPSAVWLQAIVPFLVSRILLTGDGGFHNGRFCISSRACMITHVFHHSTSPQKPIVHLKRPQLADEFLRIQITCGDATELMAATETKIGMTAMVLLGAARGVFDGLDLSFADPVAAMHDLSYDWRALLKLSNGKQMHAREILGVLTDRLESGSAVFEGEANDSGTRELLDAFAQWRNVS